MAFRKRKRVTKRTIRRKDGRKRSVKRRRVRVARRVRPSGARVHLRGPAGFPRSLTTTLTYFKQTLPTTDGAGIRTDNKMRLNSCFDPDESGAGHQPYGFDQFAAVYKQYRVNSVVVHIIVERVEDAAQFTESAFLVNWVGLDSQYTAFEGLSTTALLERQDGRVNRVFLPGHDQTYAAGQATVVRSLHKKTIRVSVRKIVGARAFNDAEQWTATTSDPFPTTRDVVMANFLISSTGSDAGFINTQTVKLNIKLVMNVSFKNPAAVAIS